MRTELNRFAKVTGNFILPWSRGHVLTGKEASVAVKNNTTKPMPPAARALSLFPAHSRWLADFFGFRNVQ